MWHNLTVQLLEKRPGKGIQPGVRSCRTAVLSVLLQDNPHSSCPLHAMIYPVLSQWVVSPCHPPSFLVLFAAEQSPLFQLHVAHKITEARLWYGYAASPNLCLHTQVPEVLYPFSSQRTKRTGLLFMFRQCPDSNRHQHYSFPFLFLQGGVSVGLIKVCKGQTMPHYAAASFSPACPVCLQLPLLPWLNHLLCEAFVPWYSPGSAIFLSYGAQLILWPQKHLFTLIILAQMNWLQ